MTIYTFDGTFGGLLTAVFDAFERHEEPDELLTAGDALPLFCNEVYEVVSDPTRAERVFAGLEKRLSREALRIVTVSWQSELPELNSPLFRYICKVFRQPKSMVERNFADPDVLEVTNIARRVSYEAHRIMQFVRFQKAKDGTYLGVVAPEHDVLPMVTHHFADRFNDQPWLLFDARRHYGYYYYEGKGDPLRITFEDEASIPFSLADGRLNDDLLSDDDHLLQDLWRTYFKAICIRERLNPRKQRADMPVRFWRYMTEMQ